MKKLRLFMMLGLAMMLILPITLLSGCGSRGGNRCGCDHCPNDEPEIRNYIDVGGLEVEFVGIEKAPNHTPNHMILHMQVTNPLDAAVTIDFANDFDFVQNQNNFRFFHFTFDPAGWGALPDGISQKDTLVFQFEENISEEISILFCIRSLPDGAYINKNLPFDVYFRGERILHDITLPAL